MPDEGTVGWIDGPQIVKGAKNKENAIKFINFWGGNEKYQSFLWNSYKYNQCGEVENVLSKGGKEKEFAEPHRGQRSAGGLVGARGAMFQIGTGRIEVADASFSLGPVDALRR